MFGKMSIKSVRVQCECMCNCQKIGPDAEIFSPNIPETLSKCIFQLGEESLEAIAEVKDGVGVVDDAGGGLVKAATNVTARQYST